MCVYECIYVCVYVCMYVWVSVCKHYFFHTEKRCRRFYHVSQKSLNGFTNISYTDLPLTVYVSVSLNF
jgi:hypothetical protein